MQNSRRLTFVTDQNTCNFRVSSFPGELTAPHESLKTPILWGTAAVRAVAGTALYFCDTTLELMGNNGATRFLTIHPI